MGTYRSRSYLELISLPAGMLNITSKKTDNFIYTLNAVNILDTQQWRFRWDSDIPGINLESFGYIDFTHPQIKLNIAYNFGNQNVKSKKLKQAIRQREFKFKMTSSSEERE